MATFFKRWTHADQGAASADERCKNTDDTVEREDHNTNNQEQHGAPVGSEWIFIEEPVGFFFPEMKKQRQLLELDQVRHVLHYANYKRVMRMHDISLVTSVEEIGKDGARKWWMTIQDPRMLQVWLVHFPSLHRMQVWVDLLRSVVQATGSRAFVSDIVLATGYDCYQTPSTHRHASTKKETENLVPESQEVCREPQQIAILVH